MEHDNQEQRDRMRKDTALLVGKVLMMVCLAAGAVGIFRWAGTVAVLATALLCSVAILVASRFQQHPVPAGHAGKQR
jgi:hypothetical protein